MRRMLLLALIALAGCGTTDQSKESNHAYEYGNHDFYFSGMHYKVLQREYGGIFAINITLDSLKFQSYMIDSSKFVTRFKVNAKGRVIDKEYIEPMDSVNYYYTKLLKFDPLNDVDSFFKYRNLYAKALIYNK